jgi:hypothetical protein
MKLTQILTLVLIAAGIAFTTSCKSKQPPPPQVDLTPGYRSGK